MPHKPLIACTTPGCPGLRSNKGCSRCGWTPSQRGWKSDKERGTRTERGYDNTWLRLRARKLRDKPLCEPCEAKGLVVVATQVHHLKPFKGLHDPLRLDWDNLQSVCDACHGLATRGQSIVRR